MSADDKAENGFWSEIKRSTSRPKLSIALKMGISISLLVLLGMGVLAAALYQHHAGMMRDQTRDFGEVLASQLAASVTEPLIAGQPFDLDVLLASVARSERILGAAVYNNEGGEVASSGLLPREQLINLAATEIMLTRRSFRAWDQQQPTFRQAIAFVSPVRFKDVTAGYVLVVISAEAVVAIYQRSFQVIVIITVLLSLSISALAIVMGRRLSQPIRSLVKATEEIGEGNLTPIKAGGRDEIGRLIDRINDMRQDLEKKSQVENRLEQLLTKDVAQQILQNLDSVNVGGEPVEATVMFADIVGFTEISEQLTAQEVSEFLNDFFSYVSRCCRYYEGNIDKYMGDCIMVVFGAPTPNDNHQHYALACAVSMQRIIRELNVLRLRQNKFPVHLRIGINSGGMVAGMIGSEQKMEYTVVGGVVNTASRLCGEAGPGQIFIDEVLYRQVSRRHQITVDSLGATQLRGLSAERFVYNVRDIEQPRHQMVDSLIDDLVHNSPQ